MASLSTKERFADANRVETTQAAVTIANTMAVTAAIGSQISQGSDNDVRIFQLVQECQLNRSPATPTILRLSSSAVTEGTEIRSQPEPAAPPAPRGQDNPADKATDGHGADQAPSTDLVQATSQVASLNNNSPALEKCFSQQKCYSRSTIKATQSSGHSPVDTLHTGPGPHGAAMAYRRPTHHHSEVGTVVDSQSGSGTGAEGMAPSRDDVEGAQGGHHSEPQQSSLNCGHHAAAAAAAGAAAVPAPEQEKQIVSDYSEHQAHVVPGGADQGTAKLAATSQADVAAGGCEASDHAAEVVAPVEVPQKGAEQCATQTDADDQPAGVQHKDPQPDLCGKPTLDAQHTSEEEEEAADGDLEQQEDELDGFLPTQIDGLEDLRLPVEVVEPAESVDACPAEPNIEGDAAGLQDAAPLLGGAAECAAPEHDAPGTRCNTEQGLINSSLTLSCVVPDSINGSPPGAPCSLSLPAADKDSKGECADPPSEEAAVVAQCEQQPGKQSTEHEPAEAEQSNVLQQLAEAPLQGPQGQEEGPLQQLDAPEHAHQENEQPGDAAHSDLVELGKTPDGHTADCLALQAEDSVFEEPVETPVTLEQGCQADAPKQVSESDAPAVHEPSQAAIAAGGEPMQPTVSAPQPAAPSKLQQAAAATPAGSGGDVTVCDSEDACMDDDAAVESAPVPRHKQLEAREKECMSDTIQDTRTQGRQNDANVPESQQTVVRQQRAPPTPVLKQQNSNSQPETPDMFGGPAVSAQAGVAKPAKSRGGALVAAVVGQPEKSTATAGDMHGARSGKAVNVKAQYSPAPPAPPSKAPTPPQPRSRHDRVHNKRAAHAHHDVRIHRATGAAAHTHHAPQCPAACPPHGDATRIPVASPGGAPRSRSPSPLPRPDSRIPPKASSGSAARGSRAAAPQRTPSPLPQEVVRVSRSDLGAPHAVLIRSPGPTTSHRTATPEQHKGNRNRNNSHSRSPSMHDSRSAGTTPSKSTHKEGPQAHAASVSDCRQGDYVPPREIAAPIDIAATGGIAVPSVAGKHQVSRENIDEHQSMHTNTANLSKPSGSHAGRNEALTNAVKHAAMTADQTISGAVHVSRTCLMTESQLSLQNWIEAPGESTQKTAPKKSPPRFPKSPQKPATTVTPTTVGEESDDDFNQLVSNSAEPMLVTETEREEIEWGQFKQRRSCGKPSHVLDSQSAITFLSEELGAPVVARAPPPQSRNEEDIPLADRGKRKLPQAGGRRVKQHSAPAACSGESAGAAGARAAPLRIPRIAVASQQGSQDIERGAKAQKLPKVGQGRQSAPAVARSPAAATGGGVKQQKGAGADRGGWKGRSPGNVTDRAVHAQPRNHNNGAVRQAGASTVAKSPLRDSGNIPVGAYANAQNWARDGDRDYKCKQDPEHAGDRSPRRSARIAQHNITPAADADKALANLSQMCILTQDTSEVDDPDYDGGRIPTLPLHRTSDQGNRQNGDRKPLQSPPGQRKRKLATELPLSKPSSTDENGLQCGRPGPQIPCARTPGGKPVHATARPSDTPSGRRAVTTPDRSHDLPCSHKGKQSPVSRDHRTSGDGRDAAHTRDGHSTPPRSPSTKASPKASPQAGCSRRRCEMEWIEPAVQKNSFKVFYNGLCSSSIGDVHCGDVVAVETPGNQIMIKVDKMWENVCAQEMCVSGVRLYPILETPVHAFAPSGVDKKRCVALGEDIYTFERESVLRKLSVFFVGEGKGFSSEADALRLMKESPAAFLCRLAVQDSGGALPLNS